MSYIGFTFGFILAILVYGGTLYVRRQIIKRRNRYDLEIPNFLAGGEYPADNSVYGVEVDEREVCNIYTRCR